MGVRPITHHLSPHYRQRPGRIVEASTAVGDADHGVFGADAEAAWEIDAGLVAEDHALRQRQRVPLDQIRLLMDRETESVANSVDKGVAVSGIGDHLSCRAVDLLTGHSRSYGLERRLIGGENRFVGANEIRRGLADVNGAGDVGVVSSEGTAPIAYDGIPGGDDTITTDVVGRG